MPSRPIASYFVPSIPTRSMSSPPPHIHPSHPIVSHPIQIHPNLFHSNLSHLSCTLLKYLLFHGSQTFLTALFFRTERTVLWWANSQAGSLHDCMTLCPPTAWLVQPLRHVAREKKLNRFKNHLTCKYGGKSTQDIWKENIKEKLLDQIVFFCTKK